VLECKDKHLQDRALQQLEELSALFDRLHAPTTVASVAALSGAKELTDFTRADVLRVRMRDVYLSNYPSIWTLKQGIAATFQAIGLYKSALDLFESIHLYDGVIESCMLLGKLTQAEELIRKRLEEQPESPKFLCLLADCTRDISLYEKAWEASAHTYPRAQRSLANFKMQRQQYAEAIPHFQLALNLNPVFPAEWYAMGFCAIEIKDFDTATAAFSRTVSMDPEYANAWNNLAAAHLHLKQKSQAFSALQEAVKFKTDSWKLWENYMVTAVDLHEYGKAISAMEKVVTLKSNLNTQGEKEARMEAEEKTGEAGKRIVDEQVLRILHRVVMDVGREEGPQTFLVTRFLQLLNKIAEVVVNHAQSAGFLADILQLRGESEQSILLREKEVRCLQTAGWTDSLAQIQNVVRAHEQLVEGYLRANQRGQLQAAKFMIDALLAKLRKAPVLAENLAGQACIAQMEGLMQRINEAMPNARSHATAAAASLPSGSSSSLNIWR
jgi:tetratricopeptide (TPR) repeat protein